MGGAELQAGQTHDGMERLPGQERQSHKAPLAVGVLGVLVLCWWAYGYLPSEEATETEDTPPATDAAGRGRKEAQGILAGDLEGGKGVVGALCNADSILEGVLRDAPTTGAKSAA